MWTEPPIKIHWSPRADDGSLDAAAFIDLCRCAEVCGFESVHIPVTSDLSTGFALASDAGRSTARLKFRIGWDFESVLASLFGREMKEAWETLDHRLIFHMSFRNEELAATKHDFLRAGEFLTNCRCLFEQSEAPEFDVEGESAGTAFLAIKHADCLWRHAVHPRQAYADALPVLHFGKRVGLLASVVTRETREQALNAAKQLLPNALAERLEDAANWVIPCIWRDHVSDNAEQKTMFVGSFEEVAGAMNGFKQAGILQFLIRTRLDKWELECFGKNVLPRIRGMEANSHPCA